MNLCNPFRPCHCGHDEWAVLRLTVGPVLCALYACWAVTLSTVVFVPLLAVAVAFTRTMWLNVPTVAAGALYGMTTMAVAGTTGEVLGAIAGSAPLLAACTVYLVIRDPFHWQHGTLTGVTFRPVQEGDYAVQDRDATLGPDWIGATRYDRHRQTDRTARQLPASRPQPVQAHYPPPPPPPVPVEARRRLAIEATSREDTPDAAR